MAHDPCQLSLNSFLRCGRRRQADVLGIAAITENLPRNITLFGIEPKRLSTGLSLSTEVARNLSRLVDMVAAELKDIGVEVQAKNR